MGPVHFGFSRTHPETGELTHELTGGGKAGTVTAHVVHAVKNLLEEHGPVEVEFSAIEPLRQKAYRQLMWHGASSGMGNGQYEFMAMGGSSHWIGPQYFKIVHKAAADLPAYSHYDRYSGQEMEPAAEPRREAAFNNEPLELAGNEPVEQEPWQEQPGVAKGGLSYKTKFVPLGDNDYLHFESLSDSEGNDPDIESVREQYGLDYPHEVLWARTENHRALQR